MKTLHLLPAACFLAGSAFAQIQSSPSPDLFRDTGGTSLDGGTSPSPAPSAGKGEGKDAKGSKDAAGKPSGPTIITSTGDMTYEERTHCAVFTGPDYGVFVQDPQFTVNCDKLTAYMRHAATPGQPGGTASLAAKMKAGKGSKPAATPRATPAPKASPGPKGKGAAKDADKASGLQRAVAEGNPDHPIVIRQEKPAANGAEPEIDIGIAQKADYDADTGDIVLTGWPKVSQGINTQIATSEGTVMVMNRNNNTMKTHGPSRTVIEEKTTEPKASPSPGESSTEKSSQ